MNVNHVWNFDPDMDIQKFLRYRRNFCTPNMPLAAINTLGGGGTPPETLISEMSIQGPFYTQNLMKNETIESDFEFTHIRHT